MDIIRDYKTIELDGIEKVKVGIVGEIYVKFSPLANRFLENYLIEEGAEPNMAGLMDFALFYIYGRVLEYDMYRIHKKSIGVLRLAYKILCASSRISSMPSTRKAILMRLRLSHIPLPWRNPMSITG